MFPDFAYQVRPWFQSRFTWLPAGRRHLTGLYHMLEGFYLADQFGNIPTNLWSQHFHGPDDKIGVNEEPSTDIYTAAGIIDAVNFTYATTRVSQ